MPLQLAQPPIAAREAVHRMLGRMVASGAAQVPALEAVSPTSLGVSTPHRVAILGLDAIGGQMSLRSAAQKKGWRFFVHNGDKVVASVNSSLDHKKKYRFAHLNDGPFVMGTEHAIRRAEQLEAVKDGHFEPALLLVPALHVVALWLINMDSEADLVMPIPPAPEGLSRYRAVASADFVAVLADLASQKRQEHRESRRSVVP